MLRRMTAVLLFCLLGILPSQAAPTQPDALVALPGFPRTEPQGSFYASPTLVDVTNDGVNDILLADAGGCVWGFSRTGTWLPGFPWKTNGTNNCDGGLRINNSLAVGDIDGDAGLEIVAGTRGSGTLPGQRGKVWAWNTNGQVIPGWPQEMWWENGGTSGNMPEVYTVALANISGSGEREIIAGTSDDGGNSFNLFAWDGTGTLVGGYPKSGAPPNSSINSAGIFGHVAAANVDGSGLDEIVVGRDHIYTHIYRGDGQHLAGWPAVTYLNQNETTWGVHKYVEFTRSGPIVADLDNNGTVEIAIGGKVRDPQQGHAYIYNTLLVFQSNGARRPGWEVGKATWQPMTTNSQDYVPNTPVVPVDLTGDGVLELVVTYNDGTIRAYSHTGQELWLYNYANARWLQASEVVVGDVTGDGVVELVFGLFAMNSSAFNDVGVMALNRNGQPIGGYPQLLNAEGTAPSRGIMAAPTLTDLNNDCRTDILAHSRGGSLYAWSTSGLYDPKVIPWPTSRGGVARRANYVRPSPPVAGPPYTPKPNSLLLPYLHKGCL